MKNFISWVHRHTSTGTYKHKGDFLVNFSATEIHIEFHSHMIVDRIPSTTPGAEQPRDAKDSGEARSHSTHLETSSSNRP